MDVAESTRGWVGNGAVAASDRNGPSSGKFVWPCFWISNGTHECVKRSESRGEYQNISTGRVECGRVHAATKTDVEEVATEEAGRKGDVVNRQLTLNAN